MFLKQPDLDHYLYRSFIFIREFISIL